jgi:hypothetical protein
MRQHSKGNYAAVTIRDDLKIVMDAASVHQYPRRRKIVCLCGSTRFKEAFEKANKEETLKGNIVLSVGYFGHSDPTAPTPEQKKSLDELHFDKIWIADEVLFLNVNGYMGQSTLRGFEYAVKLGKKIRFLEPQQA